MGPYTANRRLYLDKSGNLVEENDPNKATLLVHAGGTLPRDVAERYGLTEEKAAAEPPANKARRKRPPIRARPSNAAPDRRRSAGAGRWR